MIKGPYYAEDRKVFRKPQETKDPETGMINHTLGFMVCEGSEWVPGAAEAIAEALNLKTYFENQNVDPEKAIGQYQG